ncbi:MAG: outer membrane lipoprotein carrier protein LolA [Bacteroidota bacterium]
MIKNNFITVIFLLVALVAFGQDKSYTPVANMKEVETKLNNNSSKITTISCEFTQEKHLEYLDETIISKGRFWFKKENKLRWEYATPFKYLILINGGKFTIKDEKKTSEYDINSNKAFQEINNLIISSVKGTLTTDGKFEMQAFENATSYMIRLTPKDPKMKKIISKTELYFDKKDLSVSKVKLIENEKDYTIITFINKKLNEAIQDNIFIIK